MLAAVVRIGMLVLAGVLLPLIAARAAETPVPQQSDRGQTRVIGGHKAVDGAWPSQVKIYVPDPAGRGRLMAHCGGTAIASEWILTAAHCIIQAGAQGARQPAIPAQDLTVIAGVARVPAVLAQTDPILRRAIRVKAVVTHPEFDPKTFANDIALLHLEKAAGVPAMPLTGQLDRASDLAGLAATIVGWGFTQDGSDADAMLLPADLQEVELPIVDIATCSSAYRDSALKANSLDDRNLCAGFKEGGRDACRGDSGGPLMVRAETGEWVQGGVVSWGEGCGRRNRYGIYTRVAAFDSWLREVTGDQIARPLRPSPEARFTGIGLGVAAATDDTGEAIAQPLLQLTTPAEITRSATTIAPGDRALIIGIDGYPAPLTLVGSINDAAAMADLAVTDFGFRRDQVLVLTNEKATRANILAAFDAWIIQGTQPGSRVLVYYSGQGFQSRVFPALRDSQAGPSIAPMDLGLVTDVAGKVRDVANVISPTELAGLFARLSGRTVTAVFDTTQTTRRALQRPARAYTDEVGTVRSVEAVVDLAPELIDLDLRPASSAFAETTNTALWVGAASDQWALVDRRATAPIGAFTRQFVDSLRAGRLIAGARNQTLGGLKRAIDEGGARFCESAGRVCRLGLNPQLVVSPATLSMPLPIAARPAGLAARALPVTQNPARLTIETNSGDAVDFARPLKLTSRQSGYVLLLLVGGDGQLSQIYPDVARLTALAVAGKSKVHRVPKDVNVISPEKPVLLTVDAAAVQKARACIVVAVEADRPVQAIDLPTQPLNAHDATSALIFVSDFLRGLKVPDESGRLQDVNWSFDARILESESATR